MKRTKTFAVLALVLVMALGMVTTAGATSADRYANIKFKEGSLSFETNLSALDFQFGEYEIPAQRTAYFTNGVNSQSVSSTGAAGPTEYNLSITDTRSVSLNWTCTVSMTNFIDQAAVAPSFSGSVFLKNGVTSSTGSGLTSTTMITGTNYNGTDPEVGAGTGIMVASGGTPANVIAAQAALGSGIHTVTWQDEDVALNIGDSFQGNGIRVATYRATMTWTLTI